MPRQLRLQYPGAMYQVMSRGNRREKIFRDDVDRQDFIKTLTETCQKTGWQVHAYCLMPKLHRHMQEGANPPQSQTAPRWQEDMSANE
jgi:putative transposase